MCALVPVLYNHHPSTHIDRQTHTDLYLLLYAAFLLRLSGEGWHCRLSLLQNVDGAGECGEVVTSLSVEEGGVGESPHVLRLDLRPGEARLNQHPHKQWQKVCSERRRERQIREERENDA